MHQYYGKSMSTNFSGFPQGFVTFFRAMGYWWGNPYISLKLKYNTGWESNGKEHQYYGKNIGTNFTGFAHLMVFAEFSHAIGNWLENPYIFHVMKSTIGWESNGKKAPILWEKCEYQFPRSSPYDGFCCIFLYYGKLMGKPRISHMMRYTIGWESDGKEVPILWKKSVTDFLGFSHTIGFVAFSCNMGNWWENPCISHMLKYAIGCESDWKRPPILWEKYDYQFPKLSPYDVLCCIFPCYGKLMEQPKHFPYHEIR